MVDSFKNQMKSEPEETFIGGLNSAYWILREACVMHDDYAFHGDGSGGYRYANDSVGAPAKADVIAAWRKRIVEWESNSLRNWAMDRGKLLLDQG